MRQRLSFGFCHDFPIAFKAFGFCDSIPTNKPRQPLFSSFFINFGLSVMLSVASAPQYFRRGANASASLPKYYSSDDGERSMRINVLPGNSATSRATSCGSRWYCFGHAVGTTQNVQRYIQPRVACTAFMFVYFCFLSKSRLGRGYPSIVSG